MIVAIPGVLDAATVAVFRAELDAADWIDGNATSGHQSALAKRNRQLPEGSPVAQRLGGLILDALGRNPQFIATALPLRVYPPLFNRYRNGDGFDDHIDSAVRIRQGSDFRIRSDLSATLFLSDPGDYDGGELTVEDVLGSQSIRLPAGDLLLYPASSLHRVSPVTRGARLASFFWVQSMVRDAEARRTLYDLDRSIQALAIDTRPDHPAIVRLTGVYHNLLRRWAEM
ncbi:Fe2+-dependent dioxygenase [Sphingomonas bacterium]|uniref:Fe2+-dependent dioxygenase n=1 Tax=Sphingomonas bacterium TaxID=1895847 RepID=UPI0015774105|nr:Fe2+-dependent dioxygenase [Sphingomonas bacterium]